MNYSQPSDRSVQEMTQFAAERLGMNAEQLQQAVSSGSLHDIEQKMTPGQSQQLREWINNPETLKRILQSDAVKNILRHLSKKE